MIEKLINIRKKVKDTSPLIHCITNPISINDCANFVLSAGAKPIMAEHPLEVEEITETAQALAVNLGNITDARMESINLSGRAAKRIGIPTVIDIVGVGCSTLRLNYAREFVRECEPCVIKGNMSEIKALADIKSTAFGIDVGKGDTVNESNLSEYGDMVCNLANKYKSVVAASGKIDIISDGKSVYGVYNGCDMMSQITGTGCILNVLIGTYISSGDIFHGVLLGTAMLGICGELSSAEKGMGSFKTALLDNLYLMDDRKLKDYIKIIKIK